MFIIMRGREKTKTNCPNKRISGFNLTFVMINNSR